MAMYQHYTKVSSDLLSEVVFGKLSENTNLLSIFNRTLSQSCQNSWWTTLPCIHTSP